MDTTKGLTIHSTQGYRELHTHAQTHVCTHMPLNTKWGNDLKDQWLLFWN